MKGITFCNHCRGMMVGWNRKYVIHHLRCSGSLKETIKVLGYSVAVMLFIVSFPVSTPIVFSGQNIAAVAGITPVAAEAAGPLTRSSADQNDLTAVERLLRACAIDETERFRIAAAIVASSQKHRMDPRLVASLLIVESGANSYAVSERKSIGIMQIHLPTWKSLAELEDINLFNIEENVELGTRILKGYVRRFGLWQGVIRYKGGDGLNEAGERYLEKVRRIYYGYSAPASERS